MFRGLEKRWNVSGRQLLLILCVFAITGTTVAWISRSITTWLSIPAGPLYYLVKLLVLVVAYPFILLLAGYVFGQGKFFTGFLKRLLRIKTKASNSMKRIAVFASGAGSNALKIIEYSKTQGDYKVAIVVTNKKDAGVLEIAKKYKIPALIIDKETFYQGNGYGDEIRNAGVEFIVLAGFLWKVPTMLIEAFPGSIINIHPALLPHYGGKGMYGRHVHEAVLAAGEKVSGITIHFVDGHYDHGDIIFQAKCAIDAGETADSLAEKIQVLEHNYYPRVLSNLLNTRQVSL